MRRRERCGAAGDDAVAFGDAGAGLRAGDVRDVVKRRFVERERVADGSDAVRCRIVG
jgi:hypothetical protein